MKRKYLPSPKKIAGDTHLLAYYIDAIAAASESSSQCVAEQSSISSISENSAARANIPKLIQLPNESDVLLIQAFCVLTGLIVTLHFPGDGVGGWVYREDIGGQISHRWDFQGSLMLLSRHSSCLKSIIARDTCRNCFMKAVWRRECSDPEHSFFLLNIAGGTNCDSALSRISLHCENIDSASAAAFARNVPKAHFRKRTLDAKTRNRQLSRLRAHLSARTDAKRQRCTEPELFNLGSTTFIDDISEALGLERSDSRITHSN